MKNLVQCDRCDQLQSMRARILAKDPDFVIPQDWTKIVWSSNSESHLCRSCSDMLREWIVKIKKDKK